VPRALRWAAMMVDPDGNASSGDHDGGMTTEQNKALAHEFFARFSAGDLDGALATLTADATWLIPGKRDRMPTAGLYTKERIARLFQAMLKRLRGGLQMTVLSAVAEGDRVALEVESSRRAEAARSDQRAVRLRERQVIRLATANCASLMGGGSDG